MGLVVAGEGRGDPAVYAGLAGANRAGLWARAVAAPEPVIESATVAPPPGIASKLRPTSVRYMVTWRMLPPGWPPSWSLTGAISVHAYVGPPAATMAATRSAMVTSAATTPSSFDPSLSW